MVPVWKIKREARRVREQFKKLVLTPYFAWQQFRYDKWGRSGIRIFAGTRPVSSNMVIVLVYQPNGLKASLFHTLAHIEQQGFSATVVLNSSASAAEIETLQSKSSLVISRPNFGYDFGGYRDAILHLLQMPYDFDSITCLNDSIWYPVFQDCDHLQRMYTIDADLIGYSYSKGYRNKKKAHVQSYFFMFKGKEFLNSPEFYRYWSTIRIANSRHFTIRENEMRMTGYFEASGHCCGWLFSVDDVRAFYESCEASYLYKLCNYLVEVGYRRTEQIVEAAKAGDAALRDAILAAFKAGEMSRNVIGSEPEMLFNHIGFAAMKKSVAKNYSVQRHLILNQLHSDNFDPSVKSEITRLCHETT